MTSVAEDQGRTSAIPQQPTTATPTVAIAFILLVVGSQSAHAQTLTVLHRFTVSPSAP